MAQVYDISRARPSSPEQKQVTLSEEIILRWKARGFETRGEAAILDTGGKEIRPTASDEIFRIQPRRITSRGIDDPHSVTPTTHSIP
jgi:hypothetical protein